MHIATCFDSKESLSGYSMNHNKNISFQSNTTIYLLSIMHKATCFDSKESSSGYRMNHNKNICNFSQTQLFICCQLCI